MYTSQSSAVNPQNPFVIDAFYFSSHSINHIDYENSWRYAVHLTNKVAAATIGSSLTALVLFLIVFRTPATYRPYSRILLFTVASDAIFTSVIVIFGEVRTSIKGGCIAVTFMGVIKWIGDYEIMCLYLTVFAGCLMMSATMLAAQSYYRYQLMKNGSHPSFGQTLAYVLIAAGISGLCGIMLYYPFRHSASRDGGVDYAQFWFPEEPIPQLAIGDTSNPIALGALGIYTIVNSSAYGASLYWLRETIRALSSRTGQGIDKQMQWQISRTFLAQTLAPLVGAVIPIAINLFGTAVGWDMGYFADYMCYSLSWFPTLNSASSLIFIVPYRRYCMEKLGIKSKTVSSLVMRTRGSSGRIPS